MTSKRKKTAPFTPHKYTTREIMEITEKRRQKEDAARLEAESKPKSLPQVKEAPAIEEVSLPIDPPVKIDPPIEETVVIKEAVTVKKEAFIGSKPILSAPELNVPTKAIMGPLALILSLIAILVLVASKLLDPWVNIVAAKLNDTIIYGSYMILSLVQGPCSVKGPILITHYYKVSIQDDLVGLYSLELLIVFAVLFAYFQKTSMFKRTAVFISLLPLAIIANILRVVVACGLAYNEGAAIADQYFYGILAGGVVVFLIIGLLLLETLSTPD